jgi:hypothetical protein
MLDDSDDKIRRNLVAASAIVIGATALGIPFDAVLNKLVDTRHADVAAHRVWAVGLAILAYMAARYRFTDVAQTLQSQHQAAFWQFARALLEKRASWHARRYSKRNAPSGPVTEDVIRGIDQQAKRMADRNP